MKVLVVSNHNGGVRGWGLVTCATLMLRASVPMKVASQILGHSSIGITADLYTHVLEDMKKEAAFRVGQEVFGEDDEDDA